MLKIFLVIALIISGTLLVPAESAHAQVGDIEICESYPGSSNHTQSLANNIEAAQTFTTTKAFTATGVKIPVRHIVGQPLTTITVRLVPTTDVAGTERPNIPGGVLATGTISSTGIPDQQGTSADQRLDCGATDGLGTVIEFASPVALNAATSYAIVIDASGSAARAVVGIPINAIDSGSDHAAGGNAQDNSNSNDEAIPADWVDYDTSFPATDMGFAVYGNVVTVQELGTADIWLENFLQDFLGLGGTAGGLIFGLGTTAIVLVGMLFLKVHILPAMAFSGFTLSTWVLALLVPAELFLAAFAIVGVSILAGTVIILGRAGGSE